MASSLCTDAGAHDATDVASTSDAASYPSFVHALPAGDLLITDSRTHTLHILSLGGEHRGVVDGGGALLFPMGVCASEDTIWVADGLADSIHRLSLSTGAHLGAVGGLSTPHGLALAGDTLFAADWGGHRIQCFDAHSLQPTHSIGRFGDGDAELCYPRGVCVAGLELFVADTENHRVQVFTLRGRHVRSIGPIREPYAVAAAHGRLFVAQMDGRLKILDLEGAAVLQEAAMPGGGGGARGGGAPRGGPLLCGLCADARRVFVAGYVAEERQLHVLAARPPADSPAGGGEQGDFRPPTAVPRAGRRAGRDAACGS